MATRSTSGPILSPDDIDDLLVLPAFAQSIATQVARTTRIGSSTFRVPLITADPSAEWVNEGDEITPSDAMLGEIVVVPSKIAGLTIITRELAEDSSPEAAQVVGDGLARDIARKMDEAFFGNLVAPAAAGLGSLTTAGVVDSGAAATADTSRTPLDDFAEAVSISEQTGANLTSFVANPADALKLAQLKSGTGSNVPLLSSDPTSPARRTVEGRPLYVSPAVPVGTIYGVPYDRVHVVVRTDSRVETDQSVYFTSDRVAVKATMRVGFAFPHAAAVVRITNFGA